MVQTFAAYLDFCYLVRAPVIDEDCLAAIQNALSRFYQHRPIFQAVGVREPGPQGFCLPRQHAIKHYPEHIAAFGAPNGLCSSITENKHIKAVKRPWCRSSHCNALGQILLTNQRLDKLAACRVDFNNRSMLTGTCLSHVLETLQALSDDDGNSSVGSDDGDSFRHSDSEEPGNEDNQAVGRVPTRGGAADSDDESDDDECGAVGGPTTLLSHIVLAKSRGTFHITFITLA
jgi:hypothetical protein